MFWFDAPWFRNDGLAETPVNEPLTVKMPVPTPVPPSGFVTVMSRVPTVAPTESVMFAVTCVMLLKVIELTVMPVPENETMAPLTKPPPAIDDVLAAGPLIAGGRCCGRHGRAWDRP